MDLMRINKNLLREFVFFIAVVIALFISISLAAPALDAILGIDFFLEYHTNGNLHIIQSNNVNALITSVLITLIVWIIRMFKSKSVSKNTR